MDAATLAGVAGAGAAVISVTGLAVKKVWPVLRKASQMINDWTGTPSRPGVPEVPGVMARLFDQDTQLAVITHRLVTVEGSVDSRSTAIGEINQRLNDIEPLLAVIHHEVVPNEGSSMKDQMNRVDAALSSNGGDSMGDQVTRLSQRDDARAANEEDR